MDLLKKIESRKAKVGIIGLGYVGLPLMREFCAAEFSVVGFDIDLRKVKQLNAGRSYIKHIPASVIKTNLKDGRFRATDDFSQLRKVEAIIICVPTPLDKMREPNVSFIESSGRQIAKALKKGHLVILESTTYPGTTREVLKPILEAGSGLRAGRDFYLAFSPEREDPGNPHFTTRTIPKVVGGIDRRSSQVAAKLYGMALERTVPVGSCEVAEATKILENVYRCVNIALVNELKVLFDKMGIDVWEVINAAATKPFGFQAFYPGPGLGGHCIPIDPFYLSWKARQYDMTTRFIELAGEINVGMPDYVINRLMQALNERGKCLREAKILVLGLAYKRDVDDMRESPSVTLIEKLREHGAIVNYNDPHIPVAPKQREHNIGLKSRKLTARMLATQDAVLISTDHSSYDYDWIVQNAQLVVDTRNATAHVKKNRAKIVKA
ncbi:MAG: nucleotide sugar dehydrogenase [Anaerolineaceae bacterium]|nr:nucleotide sugar dehydrogenase [Anaerolineaceae bacterium]